MIRQAGEQPRCRSCTFQEAARNAAVLQGHRPVDVIGKTRAGKFYLPSHHFKPAQFLVVGAY